MRLSSARRACGLARLTGGHFADYTSASLCLLAASFTTPVSDVSKNVPIRTALISVSDKLGLADLAAGLQRAGVRIYSTGGTRRHLQQSGVDVLDAVSYTHLTLPTNA